MANTKARLTEKQKAFCRAYFSNGGNGTQAYLTAYNSNSEVAAANESSILLKDSDIRDYLNSLNAPLEKKAISEREEKRNLIKSRIEYCVSINDDAAVARYMDILNKMDNEYININRNIEAKDAEIVHLDTSTLKELAGS